MPRPSDVRRSDTGDSVRREAGLVVRLASGAAAGAVVAVPFLLLLLLVVSESESLERVDRGVADAVNAWELERQAVVQALEVLAWVTHPWTFRIVVLAVAVVLWRRGRWRLAGHAMNSLLGVAVLLLVVLPRAGARERRVVWAAGVLVVLVTGLDRIGLGVHYLSDVIGGWIVALALVTGTAIAFGTGRTRAAG